MKSRKNISKIKTKTTFKITLFKLRISLLAVFIILPNLASARTYNPNNIITDQELMAKSSLSQAAIQKFLERKNSVLARYQQEVEGKNLTAAQMVWQVSQKHNVSPKYILTTLEKEQGLLSRTTATAKALDWATGYGCYGGGCKEKYRGFYNQIEASAETQQIYIQKAGQFGFKVNQTTKSYDNYQVTPANQATANLYIYTPYVGYSPELGVTSPYGGNRLFWRIWHRYFSHQKFLDGQIVKADNNFYLIQDNQKRKFASVEVLQKDYLLSDVISASAKDLSAYENGPVIYFGGNTLVKSASSQQIYLITNGQKRPILDNQSLALLSDFQIAEAAALPEPQAVSEDQLAAYSLGTAIAATAVYPQGKLFKDPTNNIWLIRDNLKHAVASPVWQRNFQSQTPNPITTAELEKYPTGEPIRLKDGTFVLSGSDYYLITDGERCKINDLGIFDRLFGVDKKNSAIRVSNDLLTIHAAGEIIDYIDDTIIDAPGNLPAVTDNSNGVPSIPSVSGQLSAELVSLEPAGIIVANYQTQQVTVKLKNLGDGTWSNNNIYLSVTDKDKTTSSLQAPAKIYPQENAINYGQTATFVFTVTGPANFTGALPTDFSLYALKNNQPVKILSLNRFAIIKTGEKPANVSSPAQNNNPTTPMVITAGASVTKHTIPIAVDNAWKPVTVKVFLKNNSQTTWLSRRTALEIYNNDNTTSYFYDPKDWVRKEVAGVPLNATSIKPGQTGEFVFTLDPRGIKAGTYTLKIRLRLLDKNSLQVPINGKDYWILKIRVD